MLDPKNLKPDIDLSIPRRYAGFSFSQVVKGDFIGAPPDQIAVLVHDLAEHVYHQYDQIELIKQTQPVWKSSGMNIHLATAEKIRLDDKIKRLEAQVIELESRLKAA